MRPARTSLRHGFTLMEIMIVVALIGLLAAMGMPAINKMLQKEGMRKGLSDLKDVCAAARAKAILSGQTASVMFHPRPESRSFAVEGGGLGGSGATYVTSATLPDGVDFAMLDINLQDFGGSEWARVRFFPNGTCDEMKVVLHDKTGWRMVTLEFSTAIASVSDVDK